ncbi:uncharacterized protein LOC116211674 [Punica granatum]|uniref:Uncharacterized protein LOC116211674 n=1 Tax=Punica granatum TaxID=22663 RepID=A0A6P8E3C9_PUNGR|nr:uncharacterized protein LOC116211674 [Punica granatum]
MGLKRPFEIEDLQEPQKHSKQAEPDFKEAGQVHGIFSEPDISDGDKYVFPNYSPLKEIGNDFIFDIPYFDIEVATSGASSLVTHGSSEEDVESETVGHFEDVSSSLDCSPERIVPIGSNHQARLPPWVGQMYMSELYNFDKEDTEENYLGTCIIPMPDESTFELDQGIVGGGRKDCSCIDKGSMRCVRQHITESQEDVRTNLDDEKFVLLGLADLGEEVACEWSEEEEQLFNEVVFSNPVSAGKNFWKRLSATFSSRTKRELVSYYFNVFMLRKRATQNRCRFLDIDSDDDEWHRNMYEIPKEVDVFQSASLGYNNQWAEHGNICIEQDEDGDEGEDDEYEYEYGDVDNDEEGIRCHNEEAFPVKSFAENTFGNWDERTDVIGDFFGLQDDSCTSFDYLLTSPVDTHGPVNGDTAVHAKARSSKSCEETDGSRGVDDAKGIVFQESKESNK